jgi:hypothetical protein
MQLLTTHNPKISKGSAHGYHTAAMHLAPSTLAGVGDVCPHASDGCRAACLNTAGRGGIFRKGENTNAIQDARIRRTRFFMRDRAAFLRRLRAEIALHEVHAEEANLRPAVRLNATSDLDWLRIAPELFGQFARVQFYDYTKSPKRMHAKRPRNYHLTFSRSESNKAEAARMLASGHGVAVVFRNGLPPFWHGVRVIDGDAHDLRFLDPSAVGLACVVGLRAKGRGRLDTSGFVVGAAS